MGCTAELGSAGDKAQPLSLGTVQQRAPRDVGQETPCPPFSILCHGHLLLLSISPVLTPSPHPSHSYATGGLEDGTGFVPKS